MDRGRENEGAGMEPREWNSVTFRYVTNLVALIKTDAQLVVSPYYQPFSYKSGCVWLYSTGDGDTLKEGGTELIGTAHCL